MATTISLSNQKGGVGKTSSTYHLGGALALAGHRVLLVDNDPQASLSQGLWGPDATRQVARAESVAALYDADLSPIPEVLIRPTAFERLSVVPGSRSLTPFNMMPVERWHESERGMREFVQDVAGDFDLILIDNPPNLHLCSWAALVASDFIVIPLTAEDFASQGIADVQEAIAAVQSGPNPALSLLGLLLTMHDKRLGIHLAYESMLREMYGEAVFVAPFPLATDYKVAVASRTPISHFKPKGAAGKAARAVADELLARVARHAEESERSAA